MSKATVAVIAAVLAATSGCADRPSSSRAPDKYAQTWTKSYATTTCAEWSGSMSERQRWVAAADILAAARSKDGSKELPSDALVSAFQSGVTGACNPVATMTITDAAVGVYLAERSRFGP